jgi:CubicO group peptidase (beta-lactamase class C family)
MKNILILNTVLFILTISCNPIQSRKRVEREIIGIENNLLPYIAIEGDIADKYNIHDRMKYYQIPGVSIAFLNNGEIVWAKGYGFTSYDSLTPITTTTLFQAASVSKPIAAMGALTLVEYGIMDLDTDVNNYLEDWKIEENEFTRVEKVTLRRLLSHSAGLTCRSFLGYSKNEQIPDIEHILRGINPANSERIYPDIIPGSEYRYSGGAYVVTQKILTDITRMSFPELMDRQLFSKSGMVNSTFEQFLTEDQQSNAAIGHRSNGEMVKGKWHIYPEMAAAGLWTTPTDLLRFAAEICKSYKGLPNTIISKELANEMLTPQISKHGLGLRLESRGDSLSFSHNGANEGYRCQLFTLVSQEQGVVIMTNGDQGSSLIGEILRSFSDYYGWNFYKPVKKPNFLLEISELQKYVGEYSLDAGDTELTLEVSINGSKLRAIQKWDDQIFDILPESELVFFNKEDGLPFEFQKDENGEIINIKLRGRFIFIKKA